MDRVTMGRTSNSNLEKALKIAERGRPFNDEAWEACG